MVCPPDFVELSELISGPDEPMVVPEPGCEPAVLTAFDWDEDSDIDLRDLRGFQAAVERGRGRQAFRGIRP